MEHSQSASRKRILVLVISFLGWDVDILDMFLLVLVKDDAWAELSDGVGHARRDASCPMGQSLVGRWVDGSANWRLAFMIGAIPAFLAVLVRVGLTEPKAWVETKEHSKAARGSLGELFSDPEMRRRLIVAKGLALFGIAGYWCMNFEA